MRFNLVRLESGAPLLHPFAQMQTIVPDILVSKLEKRSGLLNVKLGGCHAEGRGEGGCLELASFNVGVKRYSGLF